MVKEKQSLLQKCKDGKAYAALFDCLNHVHSTMFRIIETKGGISSELLVKWAIEHVNTISDLHPAVFVSYKQYLDQQKGLVENVWWTKRI